MDSEREEREIERETMRERVRVREKHPLNCMNEKGCVWQHTGWIDKGMESI